MTSITTLEGCVEGGQIRLRGNVALPEQTRVYVVVPEMGDGQPPRVRSPRLVHPEEAAGFAKEVLEESNDDGV